MATSYTIAYFERLFKEFTYDRKLNIVEELSDKRTKHNYVSNKLIMLDTHLKGYAKAISKGTRGFAVLGKSPKARILKALKLRKKGKLNVKDYL
jgi:hypothetical protein